MAGNRQSTVNKAMVVEQIKVSALSIHKRFQRFMVILPFLVERDTLTNGNVP